VKGKIMALYPETILDMRKFPGWWQLIVGNPQYPFNDLTRNLIIGLILIELIKLPDRIMSREILEICAEQLAAAPIADFLNQCRHWLTILPAELVIYQDKITLMRPVTPPQSQPRRGIIKC
jgi:hypothetical protein